MIVPLLYFATDGMYTSRSNDSFDNRDSYKWLSCTWQIFHKNDITQALLLDKSMISHPNLTCFNGVMQLDNR